MLQLTAEFCNKRYIRLTFNHQITANNFQEFQRRAKSTLDLNLTHSMMICINAIFDELRHEWAGLTRRNSVWLVLTLGPTVPTLGTGQVLRHTFCDIITTIPTYIPHNTYTAGMFSILFASLKF